MKQLLGVLIGMLITSPACASASLAAMTEKDAIVITRIVGLLQNKPQGSVKIAVVANTPASEADASRFLSLIESKQDKKVNAVSLRPEELAASKADVVVIPHEFDAAQFDMIFAVASEKKIVTISTSGACLELQRCAIAFKSDPAVDIRLSQSAAAATDVKFSPTLRMMIKEVP
jgi:hypothetical protein